ncbi:MAG: hypothetical protein P4L84_11070 [Isosphaeraceae bacterium]|nr:hypothetical protein [Isosphaeraceae bacterium]
MSEPTKDDQTPTAKGKSLHRTDQELERLSEVTQWDVNQARAFWEDNAPDDFKGLIEAEPKAEEPDTP